MSNFFLPIFATWFVTFFLQLVSWPYLAVLTKKDLVDRGWGLGRLSGWLMIGLTIWFLAHFKLPINTTLGIWSVFGALLLGSLYLIYRWFDQLHNAFRHAWPLILTEELLFILGFLFLSFIRAHNPQILDLEKFMDNGFMAAYIRSATLPAVDMWLSGESINYYTFGHFLGSIMARLWLTPLRFGYNLLLALIMGFSFSLSFSVVVNLITPSLNKTRRLMPLIIGGLVGSFFVTVGGNTHTIWYFLKNGHWQGYWYADATRFIFNTIHEFPSYSFVVSDLHAHVWSLPLVLGFIIWLFLWSKQLLSPSVSKLGPWLYSLVLGIFLGVFIMTSTWDFMIYGLLLAVVGIILLIYKPKLFLPLVCSAALIGLTAALIAAPWYLNFTSISQGPALVTQRTPIWQLFVLWSGHLIISALALILAGYLLYANSKRLLKDRYPVFHLLLIIGMVTTAWILLLLPELIYFKDIYSAHPRANTMFKFTYQAFILMSLAGGWAMGIALIRGVLHLGLRILTITLTLVVFGLVLLFPYFAYRDYYGALKDFKGLDGWAWLEEQYPNDLAAISWLEENVSGQPTILEAWGESYTTRNRVSAYTGLPTVIGWRVHEWLWRGGFDIAGERSGHVDEIYLRPLSAESLNYLNQYQVEYIIIGDEEYAAYPDLSFNELLTLGPTVFQSGNTYIIKYTPQLLSTTN